MGDSVPGTEYGANQFHMIEGALMNMSPRPLQQLPEMSVTPLLSLTLGKVTTRPYSFVLYVGSE